MDVRPKHNAKYSGPAIKCYHISVIITLLDRAYITWCLLRLRFDLPTIKDQHKRDLPFGPHTSPNFVIGTAAWLLWVEELQWPVDGNFNKENVG